MLSSRFGHPILPPRWAVLAGALAAVVAIASTTVSGARDPVSVLRIGTSGALIAAGKQEATALATLQNFVKTETGLNNEIVRQKDWQQLAEKMAAKEIHIGV